MSWSSSALRRFTNPALALLVVDAGVAMLSFYVAVAIRFDFDLAAAREFVGALPPRAVAFTACMLVGLLSMGLYRPRQRPTAAEAAVRTLLGITVGGVLSIVLFYLLPAVSFGRGGMALALVLSAALMFTVRIGMLRLLDFNPIKRRVLVIGTGEAAAKIRGLRRRADRRRFDVVGFVASTPAERAQAQALDIEPLMSPEEAAQVRRLDEIVVALDDRRGALRTASPRSDET